VPKSGLGVNGMGYLLIANLCRMKAVYYLLLVKEARNEK
jgi:hypothetical protein